MEIWEPILTRLGPKFVLLTFGCSFSFLLELQLLISKPQRSLLSSVYPLPFPLFSSRTSQVTSIFPLRRPAQSAEVQAGSTDSLNIQEGSSFYSLLFALLSLSSWLLSIQLVGRCERRGIDTGFSLLSVLLYLLS